ncbi:hypothetical protein [Lactobacillus kitasatonis]|uniref:hypothetical protein n=1 Tax=Lactobacillus kitasatonis TaxID=237446 RepID=UPI003F66F201
MKANEYNHLIILGNGFDLKCGLHTTYEAFFDERFGIEEACEVNKAINKNDYRKKLKENLKNQIKDNGFNTSYFDNLKFIKQIVLNTFKDSIGTLQQDHKELLEEEQKRLKDIKYTKWDAIFLFTFATLTDESIIYWNDVERIIYFVITWVLEKYEEVKNRHADDYMDDGSQDVDLYLAFTQLFSNFEFEDLGYLSNMYIENEMQLYAPEYLRLIIEKQFIPKDKIINSKNIDSVAIGMLQSLNEFERNFSAFIVEQINKKDQGKVAYVNAASDLLSLIIQPHIEKINSSIVALPKVNLDILNFNYSLNQKYILPIELRQKTTENWNINSFTNIHGIATNNSEDEKEENKSVRNQDKTPAPIFGVDSHDIFGSNNTSFNDPRVIFTKSFRLLDNHVNDIRTTNFQDRVDVITFFGHSLSHADYSYFESIFDKYKIFDSNVKLEFYYYPGDTKGKGEIEKRTENKRQERQTMKNVVKLLTTYGETVANVHGENIINKLMLEQRLSVLPYPDL